MCNTVEQSQNPVPHHIIHKWLITTGTP
jgi:hypothetical protein